MAQSKLAVFGTCCVTTDEISATCTMDLADVLRTPVQGRMKKANKQIRETKQPLGMKDAHGLLILVNDSNYAIDPSLMFWIISESCRRGWWVNLVESSGD